MNKEQDVLHSPVRRDIDPEETAEWIEALRAVIKEDGPERAEFLMQELLEEARQRGATPPYNMNTPYVNTIPVEKQLAAPGDYQLEWRLRSFMRWNAMAMVTRANKASPGIGGHIASYASAATLYEVGFNHFFRARNDNHGGDSIFFQGHSSPGIYARAYLEGRLSEQELDTFRRELTQGGGLSSYPHPWLMPNFWQYPTVSMGLGPIMAIYQARFMFYLHHRGLIDRQDRKVWAFLGDGEMDEPESRGAIALAGREQLDNLIFVINCNLQRLDGPVRGNGKIIQELEGEFRGAGWNVLKVIWGSGWDDLLARDESGLLAKRMEEAVDGEYQNYKAKGGAYTREHFFGKYPETLKLVSTMSDEQIWKLSRGGHDPHKLYAAYHAAVHHQGQPTVILAKTVKGYGMGSAGEGMNITHQQKKMDKEDLIYFRDRFTIPIADQEVDNAPYYRPPDDSPEMVYLRQQRDKLGGSVPSRVATAPSLEIPALDAFGNFLKGSENRDISTTMAFVRILTMLAKDKKIGKHIVPIVPDEARTFGMEGLFRQLGIYAFQGQLYEPEDVSSFLYYREDISGQVLEEGINEAGAFSSWIAAATSYSNHGVSMIPFYIFYSMFGFQRIGDLAWAAADMQARGFLLGGTAGRTTLAGEGLQHQDGHSHVLASTIPNCVAYDPTYLYELAVIIQAGMRRMYQEDESVYFYLTLGNENYVHPAMPEGAEEGILKGMYLLRPAPKGGRGKKQLRVQLLGSGAILREVLAAAELLERDHGVASDVWSVTSFNELRRDGLSVQRWNQMHPGQKPRASYVEQCLAGQQGPVIAASDYIKAFADQIRPFIAAPYQVLGTDGFGRSDTRQDLRRFFEVDCKYIAYAALKALADQGLLTTELVLAARDALHIDPEKPDPVTL